MFINIGYLNCKRMEIDCIIGIDPGANGGIACWRPNHDVETIHMPKELTDIRDYLLKVCQDNTPLVFLEKLNVRPDDVTVGDARANMGKLYRIQQMIANYEQLRTTITLCDVPFCLVHPLKWQSALKLRKKGVKEEKADRKRRYRDIAGQLYPEIKPTLWNADAVLIMHFGRYILQNDLKWVMENLPQKLHDQLF